MNCSINSNAEEDYRKAQTIPFQRFGQQHVIAHAYIAEMVHGPQLKAMAMQSNEVSTASSQLAAFRLVLAFFKQIVLKCDGTLFRFPCHIPTPCLFHEINLQIYIWKFRAQHFWLELSFLSDRVK